MASSVDPAIGPAVVASPPASPASSAAQALTPSPYYWETRAGAPAPNAVTLITHNLHWATWQLLGGVEYVGEIVSDVLGLMNSRYEWALQAERNRTVSSGGRATREGHRRADSSGPCRLTWMGHPQRRAHSIRALSPTRVHLAAMRGRGRPT